MFPENKTSVMVPFEVFLIARQAAGRLAANPATKEVTLRREEIDALTKAVPALGTLSESALL